VRIPISGLAQKEPVEADPSRPLLIAV
jgi:hypothetical protein